MTSVTCVLAFLLTILDSGNPRSRLVLVGNEAMNNYRTYQIPQNQYFPTPRDNSILMAPHKISDKDTLLTSYCSRNSNMNSIMNDIASDLTEMTHPSSLELIKNADTYTVCLKKITTWWESSKDLGLKPIPFINMNSIYYSTKCTASQIIRLASEKYVKVLGEFRCFAPYDNTGKPVVNADKPIKIEQETWKRQAFYGKYETRHQYALAWFHGHLHVFRRARGFDLVWYLDTTLRDEKRNGIKIYDFMLKNYDAFENFTLALEKRKAKIFEKSPSGSLRIFELFLKKPEQKLNKFIHDGLDMHHITGELHCPIKKTQSDSEDQESIP